MGLRAKNILIVALTALFLAGFALWSLVHPDSALSASERRPLAQMPAVSWAGVASGDFMAELEDYALDQFPLRDGFRTVKAATAFYLLGQKDNNGIYLQEGYASKLEYPLNPDSIAYAAERFRFIYDSFLAERDTRVYLSVIPDKNYFMAGPGGYPALDYDSLIRQLKEQMDYAEYIDILPYLVLSDYYATDSHWRQEKILDVAKNLAAAMDTPLAADYTATLVDAPFYGVYCGQSALPLAPDELYYLDSPVLDGCAAYDFETNAAIPIYDPDKARIMDPYELFLAGPRSLITVENPHAATDKELLLFRDSFGSSIAPLLAEGYAKITLIDIRYISPQLLEGFIDFGGQDALFLYSTSVLNNSITLK